MNKTTSAVKKSNIKILIACHTPCSLLKDRVFTPIHVGREVAEQCSKDGTSIQEDLDWMKNNTIGDNTGEHISAKNRKINELTALYWAWKNYKKLGNPDYIGLMHYRRHLCFNLENADVPNRVGLIYNKQIDDDYIKKFHLSAEEVEKVIEQYDVVVAEKCDLEKIGTFNCYNHYLNANPSVQHIEDYDAVLKIIQERHPEYEEAVKTYNSSQYAYFTNIFVMKRKLFEDYAAWIFPIIFEAEERIDISRYNVSEARALGYISEWLFGIWLTHLKQTKKVKILELKRTFIEDTTPEIKGFVTPAYKKNNIAICFSTDQNYIPYLGVAIQSIIDNSSPRNNYDINVLYESLSVAQQRKILQMKRENISIRFISLRPYYSRLPDIFYTRSHFTKAIYNRFFIPQIFSGYSKVLYLDCDLVVDKDIAELYDTVLGDKYLVAAVRDYECIRWASKDKNFGISYFGNFLNLSNVLNYFQSGVLLMNIQQMRQENFCQKLFDTLERIQSPKFPDQDIFNIVCENRVLFLDARWNVEFHIPVWHSDWMQTMPVSMLYDYIESRENPWIVHYAGSKKPWHNACLEMGSYFWKYAASSPFYHEILYENLKGKNTTIQQIVQNPNEMVIRDSIRYTYYKLKYYFYKLLSKITFGKKRKKYKQKKKDIKARLKAVKAFLRGK